MPWSWFEAAQNESEGSCVVVFGSGSWNPKVARRAFVSSYFSLRLCRRQTMPGEDGNCIFAGIICIFAPVSFCSCLFDNVASGATSVFGSTRLEANIVILRLGECN